MNGYQHLNDLFADRLRDHIGRQSGLQPKELYEPGGYILSLSGKQVRPLLALVACELCGGPPGNALNAALAVELFHNFTLIHDDILDEAPLRRNQPTVHRRFGQNVAILAGDVMLVQAFRALEPYPGDRYRILSQLLQTTAIEVCEGQQMDMNFERMEHVSVEDYIRMITLKTAVLLGCSLRMGAVCADAPGAVQTALGEFGKHIGIAFQLLDDLLDCFPGASFGKQVGGDITSNKKTFLLLKAMALANGSEARQIRELLALPAGDPSKVDGMIELFVSLGVDRMCRETADTHTATAVELLTALPCDPVLKKNLERFAHQLLQRDR